MNKQMIIKILRTVSVEDELTARDKILIKSLADMNSKDRIHVLCLILDNDKIELQSKVMNEMVKEFIDDFKALRKGNQDNNGGKPHAVAKASVKFIN